MTPTPAGEALYIVPFGAQVLAMTASEFQAALARGRGLAEITATGPPSNGGEPERLLTASEIAEATPGIPSGWYLESARLGQIPHVRLGKYVRFRLGEVVEHGAVTPPAGEGRKWTRHPKGKRAVS
jgi:hypothetical protein